MLPFIIPPRGRISPTNKISVVDCQKSLVLLVKDITEIEAVYSERAKKLHERNSTLQPMLIVTEIESKHQEHQPGIHPAEIIGPPTYEKAIQLPGLIRSLNHLDSISTEEIGNSGKSLDQ
ncbi:hypothetical protein HCN44_006055 [Aphidius gifuensis]|uniref:Uncharacterized protein n=1 Tax=Aphidius gifuensis TaxID=684658 RepID=A0A835CUY3_APHGI|nr:hypothetical protein HCN44_006055 [Aphidius gifuensis]